MFYCRLVKCPNSLASYPGIPGSIPKSGQRAVWIRAQNGGPVYWRQTKPRKSRTGLFCLTTQCKDRMYYHFMKDN